MIKKFMPFAAAAMMVFGASNLAAQSSCSEKAKAECAKKCDGESKKAKEEKSAGFEFTSITLEQLNTMLSTDGVTIFDARGQDSYDQGHIDGSVLFANATLPADKNAAMIFYCGGPKCSAAPKAARTVLEAGYTNVMVFTGGWLEWSSASVDDQAGL